LHICNHSANHHTNCRPCLRLSAAGGGEQRVLRSQSQAQSQWSDEDVRALKVEALRVRGLSYVAVCCLSH
jgi:hypothetical protein